MNESELKTSAGITESRLYRRHKSDLKERKQSNGLRNCLRFCFRKRTVNMAQRRGAAVDPQTDPEGGLRELTSTWFIQTQQAPLLSHNGLFPNWFRGFISRKDAEDVLMDKHLGCFLVRLSDKALGYILSYRGRDRCRHFVINQSESGQFVVHGDSVGHDTVSELIEYFKEKPIEPFGEYLTTSCFGVQYEELYDTIYVNSKEKLVTTVHALKAQNQLSHGSHHVHQGNIRKNKTEEVPVLPRRNRHLDSGSASENPDMVCYAQVRTKKKRERQVNGAAPENSSRPPSVYSMLELQDTRSRSMPLLLSNSDEHNYRLSVTPPLPSRGSPSPEPSPRGPSSNHSPEPSLRGPYTNHSPGPSHRGPYSRHSPDSTLGSNHSPGSSQGGLCSRHSPGPSQEGLCSRHSPEPPAGRPLCSISQVLSRLASQQSPDPGAGAEGGVVYAEVPGEYCPPVDDTYEQIPGVNNPYEPVGILRPKQDPSAQGVKNEKWKRLFPDVRKKW